MRQSTADKETRKAINFDFDELELKRHYPSKFPFAYKRAWSVVKKFMIQHGFEHRQYSGYVSKEPMSYYELNKILIELCNAHPWVGPCSQQFDVTEVGETYSALDLLRRCAEKAKEYTPEHYSHNKHYASQKSSDSRIRNLDDRIRDINTIDKQERENGSGRNKNTEPER